MRPCSLRRHIAGAVLGLALFAHSAPASADWISLSSPDPLPSKLDGWTWTLVSFLVAAALAPQIVAGYEFHEGKQVIKPKGGIGLAVPGGALAVVTTAGLAFVEPNDNATALMLFSGSLWSMTGVGLGALASESPHAPWLGGSMGFSAFALSHGIMAQAGFADHPPTAIVQSLFAAAGGTGCIIDAAYSRGGERGVAIGCGVVSGLAFVHGIVRAARGDVSGRKPKPKPNQPSLAPSPWFTADALGLAVAGRF